MIKRAAKRWALAACLTAGLWATAAAEDVAIVLDASNSMWGQIDGVSKIEIAREVMGDIIDDFGTETRLGLVAYGHRRQGDCGDIETVIPVGGADRAGFLETFNSLTPRGKTPLTEAVRHAAEMLSFRDTPSTVVLLSDGIETCNADPCAVAADLERTGVAFTAHVIGFDLADEAERAQLSCIADNTGGQFFAAANADELADALGQAAQAVAEPEPDPGPAVTVDAPAEAIAGSVIEIAWQPTLDGRDFLTVVPADAAPQTIAGHIRADRGSPADYGVPGTPGAYEVRYLDHQTRAIQGTAPIVLVDGAVALDAPDQVVQGAPFRFSWTGTVNPRDFLTVVPADAESGRIDLNIRAERGSPADFVAPGAPGLYELRYILDIGRRVLAAAPMEVIPAGVEVTAPDQAAAGAPFEIAWSPTVNPRDFLTIVPADAEDGRIDAHIRADRGSPAQLTAPGEPGLYEVRYVLDNGRQVVARAVVEVTDSRVTLDAPAEVTAGSAFEVAREGTVNGRDYVTIVPADAADDAVAEYRRAEQGNPSRLVAPAEPGLYEVRYVLNEGRRPIARAPVEVTEPTVTLDAPAEVIAGSRFEVAREGTVNGRDYITIVPVDAADDAVAEYRRAEQGNPSNLVAPATPGLYEVRYVLNQGRRPIARAIVEVTEPTVTLDAPAEVTAGSRFDVAREGTVNGRDYITIVPVDAADDAVAEYRRAEQGNPSNLAAPATPGLYEVRYVLNQGRRPIARAVVEVVDAQVSLDAPAEVTAGAPFEVAREGTINRRDYITIVPVDAADDAVAEYRRAEQGNPSTLTAPPTPGLYEVRYVLTEGRRPIARAVVEVVETAISLEAPDTVSAGGPFEVTREGTVNGRDYVTIVPVDAADDAVGDYRRAEQGNPSTLVAPGTPGLYEVRYVLAQGRRPVARTVVEVVEPEVTLDVPVEVTAGGTVPVDVAGVVNDRDYVTLVGPDQPDDTLAGYSRAGQGGTIELAAPDMPGLYEVRYVLAQGRRVLARAPVEVVAVSATLDGPGEVVAGAPFAVGWDGPNRRNDRIVLVRAGAPDMAEPLASADPQAPVDPVRLQAPAEPGLYELRYVLGSTDETVARQPLEVVRLAAGLTAPDTAAAGSTIEVGWTGPGGERDRITLAPAGDSDMTWAAAARTADGNPVSLTVPGSPGTYELRYLDVANRAVLVRQPLTVE